MANRDIGWQNNVLMQRGGGLGGYDAFMDEFINNRGVVGTGPL